MSFKSLMGKSLLWPLWTGHLLILFANICHVLFTNTCHILSAKVCFMLSANICRILLANVCHICLAIYSWPIHVLLILSAIICHIFLAYIWRICLANICHICLANICHICLANIWHILSANLKYAIFTVELLLTLSLQAFLEWSNHKRSWAVEPETTWKQVGHAACIAEWRLKSRSWTEFWEAWVNDHCFTFHSMIILNVNNT